MVVDGNLLTTLQYSPRHANYTRAMSNWQRKSDYLLREIVKFQTYVDSLAAAQKTKDAFYAKKSIQERPQPHVAGDKGSSEAPTPA